MCTMSATNALLEQVGLQYIPTLIFYDRTGKEQVSVGVMEAEQLRQTLAALAEEIDMTFDPASLQTISLLAFRAGLSGWGGHQPGTMQHCHHPADRGLRGRQP